VSQKVTMQQIADLVGVSKFAVSKALSGQSGVSPDTREKIVSAAAQLGYLTQPKAKPTNRNDKNPSPDDKETLAVLIPNVRYQNRDSHYWGRILDGISAGAEELGLGLVIVTEQSSDHLSKLINPEGLIGLIGVGMISNQLLLEIRNWGVPFVLVDHEDPLIPSDTLFMNNLECSRRIVNYLAGMGHARIQFVGNVRFSQSFNDRWIGFRTMLEELDVPLLQNPELLEIAGYNRAELTDQLQVILRQAKERNELPTAFVCANDMLALSLMDVLAELGVDVPGDCSVTGFDDIDDAARSRPALSTVRVEKEELGSRAVEMILRRVRRPDGPKEKILMSGDFILRHSVGALAPL